MNVKGKRSMTRHEDPSPVPEAIFNAFIRVSPRGFTLIEVILAVVIVGILAVLAVPRVDVAALFRPSADGAANMVASDIRYAQDFAMANRLSKSIVFVTGSSSYTFNPSHPLDPPGQLPSGAILQTTLTVTFNSLGEPIMGGGGSVNLSAGGQTRTVTINAYTGKVSIL